MGARSICFDRVFPRYWRDIRFLAQETSVSQKAMTGRELNCSASMRLPLSFSVAFVFD